MADDVVANMAGDNDVAIDTDANEAADKDDDVAANRDDDMAANVSIQAHFTSNPLQYDSFF
jgi:hypothetical protein